MINCTCRCKCGEEAWANTKTWRLPRCYTCLYESTNYSSWEHRPWWNDRGEQVDDANDPRESIPLDEDTFTAKLRGDPTGNYDQASPLGLPGCPPGRDMLGWLMPRGSGTLASHACSFSQPIKELVDVLLC